MATRKSSRKAPQSCHVPGKKNKADVLIKSVPGVQLRKTVEDLQYIFLGKSGKGQLDILERGPGQTPLPCSGQAALGAVGEEKFHLFV